MNYDNRQQIKALCDAAEEIERRLNWVKEGSEVRITRPAGYPIISVILKGDEPDEFRPFAEEFVGRVVASMEERLLEIKNELQGL